MIALHWLDGAARVAAQFRSSRLLGRRAIVLRVGRYGARAAARSGGVSIAAAAAAARGVPCRRPRPQPATRELGGGAPPLARQSRQSP
jgi:hypothetical protein